MGMLFDEGYLIATEDAISFVGLNNEPNNDYTGMIKVLRSGKEPESKEIGSGSIDDLLKNAKKIVGNGSVLGGFQITTQLWHIDYIHNSLDMDAAKKMFSEVGVELRPTSYGFQIYDKAEDG